MSAADQLPGHSAGPAQAGGAPRPQLPRIIPVIAAGGLALATQQVWPGTLQAVLVLVIVYVALTNVPRVLDLVNTAPAGLARAYRPAAPGH